MCDILTGEEVLAYFNDKSAKLTQNQNLPEIMDVKNSF